jgi:hypothetical protein
MMATPICESMVMDKLLLKILGDNSKTKAKKPQTIQRPTL